MILLVIGSTLFYTLLNGIAPTPSADSILTPLTQLLPEQITGHIIEAGAGWGGMTLWFAHKYPENTVFARENAWLPFVVLWVWVKLSRN